MIVVARALVRLVGFVVLVALSAAGLALAVFSIGTGVSGPSLGRLAELLHLASLRGTVGQWLAQLETHGSVAVLAGVCGIGALLLGLLLLAGVLVPRRERLVTLSRGEPGTVAARRRPLAQVATVLVERERGVTEARVRVRPMRRRTGGRLSVRASRARRADPAQVQAAVGEALGGLTEPFKLKPRIDVRRQGARVE
jgi:hypothetical protein